MIKAKENKRFIFILKAIACLLITNSHCRALYPYFFLAIGGGFGNAIFLLVSGYCLAYPKYEFKKWYTLRQKRLLLPTLTVGAVAILFNLRFLLEIGFLSSLKWLVDKYWFVFAIAIYYCIFYFVFKKKNKRIIVGALLTHLTVYCIAYLALIIANSNSFWIESDGFSPIKVFFYLGVMLFGGCLRIAEDEGLMTSLLRRGILFYLLLCAASFAIWVIIYFSIFVLGIGYVFQIVVPFSAAIFAFSFFKLCMLLEKIKLFTRASDWVKPLADSTLEVYLVQVTLVSYCERLPFPLGLISFFASAIILGITLHKALNLLLNIPNRKKGAAAMKEKVLILNGSFCEIPLIEQAKKMGYYVITTGNMKDLIGHKYSDEYIPADYSNKEAVLEIVKNNKIDHIISCANDFGVLTAAYVAEKMGWNGHDSYETAKMLHHKDLFKEYAKKVGLPSPISTAFDNADEAKKFILTAEYPIIVKATDLTGGKGILKAENKKEAVDAIDYAFAASRSKHIVIEPFVTGVQQTFVTFLCNKKVVSYTSCNSYSPINPYLIQAETLPAENIEEISGTLCNIIESMAEELALSNGVFAFQLIRNGKKFNIIEMMRRPFGNQFLQLVEDNTDFPWHKAQIMAQTGQDCSGVARIAQKRKFLGHHGIMAPRNGVVKSYTIPEDIERHIYQKIEMCPPGNEITNYLNERIAYIFYEYESLEELNRAVKSFNGRITVEME